MPQPVVPSQTEEQSVSADPDQTAPAAPSGAPAAPPLGTPVAPGEVGRLGPYRLVKELGRGGMGAVYAALDTRLDRRLALKLMLPQFAADAAAKERFLREARAAARVKHDNVVTVYEADERDGVPYIAMEFLEGLPLDVFLKKKGAPTLSQTVRIVAEAAAGLAAAHKHGLVHRDIKPANLWLEAPNGRVKVLDFGLARPVDAEVELTNTGAVVGTPAYMSPEQARGERVDHRTDLFSLGAVLYRLCTGKLPFSGPTTMAVLIALGTEEPPPVRELNPDTPESLAVLIHQLLSKRVDERPQSALDVVKRLRAVAGELAAPLAKPAELSTSQPQLVQPQLVVVPIPVTALPDANSFADIDAGADATEHEPTAPRAQSGGKTLWVFAGLAALVAAVAVAGVIIVIKNKDGTETKIEVPDGATVTVKGKDGKTLAQVGPEKAKPAVAGSDPDRTAAEWVITQSGFVRVRNGGYIKVAAELPKEPFTLVWVYLGDAPVSDAELAHLSGLKSLTELNLHHAKVGDAGLAQLKSLKSLTQLNLNATPLTDAGLAHLKELENLTRLELDDTKVGDTGVAHLKGLKSLTELYLGNTKVGDAGLAHLKEIKTLKVLFIGGMPVSDAGLAHLKEMKGLAHLSLSGTAVTDAGLMHLKELRSLTGIELYNTAVTDTGLEHLKELRGLTLLNLDGTRLTDVGLKHLAELKGLKRVIVGRTKVTAKGLEAFHAAVPGCKIEHDGGVIEPKVAADPDRPVAEWALAQGGFVRVHGGDKDIKVAADLPKERFTVTGVSLAGAAVADADLARLKGLAGLTSLDLRDTKVSGTGLAHLAGLKGLTGLNLQGTPLTETGLAQLTELKGLTDLYLGCSPISDAGLAHLKELKGLKNLILWRTPVTDAGLEHLKGLESLAHLDLRQTRVTGTGLAHLKGLTNLKGLVMQDAPVTEAGLASIGALPRLTFLELNGAPVTDAGLAHFKDCKGLMGLELRRTGVTDAGLKKLAGLTNLTYLTLTDTKVTDAGVKELQSALPKCKIEK